MLLRALSMIREHLFLRGRGRGVEDCMKFDGIVIRKHVSERASLILFFDIARESCVPRNIEFGI